MATRPAEQAQTSSAGSRTAAPLPGTPIFTEPEVRRWPHPVEIISPARLCSPAPSEQSGDALSHIDRVLSHQNRLLLEIKSLLEHPTTGPARDPEEK